MSPLFGIVPLKRGLPTILGSRTVARACISRHTTCQSRQLLPRSRHYERKGFQEIALNPAPSPASAATRTAGTTLHAPAPTAPASIAHALLDSAGLDPAVTRRLLRQARLPVDLPERSGQRIPGDQLTALWRLLAAHLDDEMCGLFARPVRGGSTKLLCLSLIDSPNLLIALHRLRGFVHVAREDFSVAIHRAPREVRIAVLPEGPAAPLRMGIPMVLKLLHGLASWLIARPIPLRQVGFGFSADTALAEIAPLFPGPALFDEPAHWLSIAPAILEQPLRRNRQDLRAFLARTPHDWLFDTTEPPVAEQVRQFLAGRLSSGSATLAGTAAALHLTPRTLSRHLAAELRSFQSIKEEVRRDIAVEWLTTTQRPVTDIAEALGFGDPASFFRAFRSWTGQTPAEFRRHGPDAARFMAHHSPRPGTPRSR